jgi:Mor family transcriptional regulator
MSTEPLHIIDSDDQIPAEYRWLLNEPIDRIMPLLSEQIAELVELIGVRNVLKLMAYYQGQQLYIPKLDSALREIRHEQIKREFSKGVSQTALARKYGLTTSYVYQILRGVPDPDQGNLFAGE